MKENKEKREKGKFATFMYNLFVKNIDLKVFSVIYAVIIGLLIIGFGI